MKITASIVLYHNDVQELNEVISSCLLTDHISTLYLIDNSATDDLKKMAVNERVEYIHNAKNIGFGAAHNIAIKRHCKNSSYHLIINPDISFQEDVLDKLLQFMEEHQDVGLVMPKINYKNGELQRLCKLLPTPFNLFGRRFAGASNWAKKLNESYELTNFQYDRLADIPNLSGCFMFARGSILNTVGGFDERYFLYLEDIDLTRRIGAVSRTVFYPYVSVEHGYQKESYHNRKLLRLHVKSAIQYFNKWGWIFDKERKKRNQETLSKLIIKN